MDLFSFKHLSSSILESGTMLGVFSSKISPVAHGSRANLENNPKVHTSGSLSGICQRSLLCLPWRALVLVDIDLVASRYCRLVLLPQRSSGWALLETSHTERLIHVSRQRSLVERKLTRKSTETRRSGVRYRIIGCKETTFVATTGLT